MTCHRKRNHRLALRSKLKKMQSKCDERKQKLARRECNYKTLVWTHDDYLEQLVSLQAQLWRSQQGKGSCGRAACVQIRQQRDVFMMDS